MGEKPKNKMEDEIYGEIVDDIIIDRRNGSDRRNGDDRRNGLDRRESIDGMEGEVIDDFVIEDLDGSEAQTHAMSQLEERLNFELAAAKELNGLYMDKIRHQAAEFENYRNRTSKEMAQIFDKGVREVVSALLPVIDNFALATKNADKSDGFTAGMLMIQNQLHTMLENLDIDKIPTVGEKFDTKYHSAVSHIKDESLGEGIVAEELQGGYIYKDTVIRHAVVVVAN